MDEQHLVERLRNGDTRAVDALVDHYKRPLFAFILRMVNRYETAEDLFQETWIRVIRSIRRFRGDAKFSTWLYQIAMNLCRDQLRKQKGKVYVSIDDLNDVLSCDPSVDPFTLMKARRVHEMVNELPHKMREVMILKYFHDLADQDIADIVGCPEGTVKSRVYRASHILRKKWETREAE